ncbi:hypothetical protein SGFS_024950 [Streptomyces graminofaciens]|uniref:Uncharacterized protein n=1 Tax=Streptomyces graminofaciens TaxID=68212 RepID=A0ABM7F3M3_9ACTN|nr:hypothetical protein SGFS_024950 [Streptomyces graminofaciens]
MWWLGRVLLALIDTSTALRELGVVVTIKAVEGNFLQSFRSADPGAAVAARAIVSYVTRVPRPAGTAGQLG